jgi:hypothetical protein
MKLPLLSACALLLCGGIAGAADFKPDDNGYIRNWLLLEPFEIGDKASEHGEDAQKAFFTAEAFSGHFKATPKAGDKVKITLPGVTSTEVAWKAGQSEESLYHFEQKDNSLYLAVVYVTAAAAVPSAVLSIGSDDSSSWHVNGAEVLTVYSGRAVDLDQDKSSPFTLKQGVNVISASVINGGGEVGLSARILDKDGNPLKNLVVSLTPPASN